MNTVERRKILKAGLAGLSTLAAVPLLGSVSGCSEQAAVPLPTQVLSDRVKLITGAPGNVVALSANEGFVLVDSGSAELARSVQASLEGASVQTLFNTHYHAEQTGGNALFAEEGATIHSHEITRQWVSTDFYIPATDSWVEALPEPARPTETFRIKESMNIDGENIETGYLVEAHTRGDIYVFFRDSNVLIAGDVVSPLRDPELDWYAGAWIGGRVDAMKELLGLANDETQIVPAYGPVMTRAELQGEYAMMQHLYDRTSLLTTQGHSAQDILDVGVMDEIDRKFDDPYRFLYDVRKGLWAHYTNFGGSTV